VAKKLARPTDDQFDEIHRDAKRDADSYHAILELEEHLRRAVKAAARLMETQVGRVGHVHGARAELTRQALQDSIAQIEATTEATKEDLKIRVGHRPKTNAYEAAFLWRARFNGIPDVASIEWLKKHKPGDRIESLQRRVVDDRAKAVATADERNAKQLAKQIARYPRKRA
jgi:hypothetical protein